MMWGRTLPDLALYLADEGNYIFTITADYQRSTQWETFGSITRSIMFYFAF